MNDPILVSDFLNSVTIDSKITTLLPIEWVFDPMGNTLLKRKRKHCAEFTKQDKITNWFSFTCQVWGVKFNRERRNFFVNELIENRMSLESIEELIIQKKNDDQTQ